MKPIPPVNARLCRWMAAVASTGGVLLLLISAVLWTVPRWSEFIARSATNLQTEPIAVTPLVRVLGLGVMILGLIPLLWAFWTARSLFRRFADGRIFETQSGQLLRRFGQGLLIYAAVNPFVVSLLVWLVTFENPSGETIFRFGVSDHELILALVGSLILVMGSVVADAVRIADENRQIV
jgi:hypothetical protein